MPDWTFVDTHPARGRTFQRPLDELELFSLWHGLFNGGTDCLCHYEVRLPNGARDARLFSEANIIRAWISTKRRYPLAGATVCGADGSALRLKVDTDLTADVGTGFASEPRFVVREYDLARTKDTEIVFGSVASAEEVERRVIAIVDGLRPLSQGLLAQLYVFRETDPRRTDVIHLITLVAHCVADGLANITFVRGLLDTLARGGESEPPQIPLEDRLAMAIPSTDREPQHLRSLSPAIRRWRRAVGMVIFQSRMAKMQGGHTLPRRLTRSSPYVPAQSRVVSTSLTLAQTVDVIANCRMHNLAFGTAYLALAQVAMTRVLYRRYLRGEISEEEWAYRKTQPHIGTIPVNTRPYLDKSWFKKGGGGEVMSSFSFFFYQLPSMTLGDPEQYQRVLSDGAPPFSDLLTFDRFLHRARLVKKQATAFFRHPLFFEVMRAAGLASLERARLDVLHGMKRVEAANSRDTNGNSNSDEEEVLSVTDTPMVCAYIGSSLGNLDLPFPTEYPLPPTHPLSPYSSVPHPVKAGYATAPSPPSASEADMMPKIAVENVTAHLHIRPAQLYLGTGSVRGQLNLYGIYDGHVFEEGVIKEWLGEVRGAVLWYLGQPHRSRLAAGGGGKSEAAQAKL